MTLKLAGLTALAFVSKILPRAQPPEHYITHAIARHAHRASQDIEELQKKEGLLSVITYPVSTIFCGINSLEHNLSFILTQIEAEIRGDRKSNTELARENSEELKEQNTIREEHIGQLETILGLLNRLTDDVTYETERQKVRNSSKQDILTSIEKIRIFLDSEKGQKVLARYQDAVHLLQDDLLAIELEASMENLKTNQELLPSKIEKLSQLFQTYQMKLHGIRNETGTFEKESQTHAHNLLSMSQSIQELTSQIPSLNITTSQVKQNASSQPLLTLSASVH